MKQADNNSPVFSIIVPAYNTESYLPRCLDSILSQTYEDFELLLIDDGSTDKSGFICDEYALKDPRIRVFHTANIGESSRNKGLDEAKGEYVVFVDSDDYVLPDLLEEVKGMLNEGFDLIALSYMQIETDGRVIHRNNSSWVCNIDSGKDIYDYMLNRYFSREVGWEVWSQVFRRSLIDEKLRFPSKYRIPAVDLPFSFCYLNKVRKIGSLAKETYVYEKRTGSLSNPRVLSSKLGTIGLRAREIYEYYENEENGKYLIDRFPIMYFLIIRPEIDLARYLLKEMTCKELKELFHNDLNTEFHERMLKELPKFKRQLLKLPHRHATLKSLNMLNMLEGRPYLLFRINDLLLDGARLLYLGIREINKNN